MFSQGDSAFAMLNPGSDLGTPKLKSILWQEIVQEDLMSLQRPEQKDEFYVTESSSLIANIVAKTYFSKQTETKPSEYKDERKN